MSRRRGGRRRPAVVAAIITVVTVVTVAGVALFRADDDATTQATTALRTADVVSTDLVEETTYDGTLGRLAGEPILAAAPGTVTGVPATGSTVGNGDVLYSLDGTPVVALIGAVPMYRDLERWPDTTPVTAMTDGVITWVPEAGAVIEEGDVLFEVDGQPVVVLYGTVPSYRDLADLPTNLVGDDVAQLEAALERLDLLGDVDMTVDDEFTTATESVVEALEESIGAEVDGELRRGDVVFAAGPHTVAAVQVEVGSQVTPQTVVVEFADGEELAGDDVAQLQAALVELGHAGENLPTDGTLGAATEAAVRDFQVAMGLDDDGSLQLGEIMFLPEPIRVADVAAGVGASVNAGSPVLTVTGEEMLVTASLPAADQGTLDIGDAVTVELVDGTMVAATVDEVATVATIDAGAAVFAVEIVLSDTASIAGLDEAPVEIHVVTDSVEGVTAVPVSALVVLREGGYAVEIIDDGAEPRLVAVDPGFFSDGLVEITGEPEPGDLVVVP
jgi:hypothetical protein